MTTLLDFKYKRKFVAGRGQDGQGSKCYGRDGENLTIKVPMGTIIRDVETNKVMADLFIEMIHIQSVEEEKVVREIVSSVHLQDRRQLLLNQNAVGRKMGCFRIKTISRRRSFRIP